MRAVVDHSSNTQQFTLPVDVIYAHIVEIRGRKVIIDADLARMYGVPTKRVVEAVKRNIARFPDDFMFQLTDEEFASLRSQIATSNSRGGRRHLPYAFTEQGVAMLSSVLRSSRAIAVNIAIMRAFVQMRSLYESTEQIGARIDEIEQHLIGLEAKHSAQIAAIFTALRELARPPEPPRRPFGFTIDET